MTRTEYRNLAKSFLQRTKGDSNPNSSGNKGSSSTPYAMSKFSQKSHSPRLRYIRFKCIDLVKTIDFYLGLGMNVDYRVSTVVSERDEKSTVRTIVAFSYPPATALRGEKEHGGAESHDLDKPPFQLIFDHVEMQEKNKKGVSIAAKDGKFNEGSSNESRNEHETKKFASALMTQEKHNYEYLVVYVHMLTRMFKKLSLKSSGADIVIAPVDISDTKLCIVRDPNGIEIRLFELNDAQTATKKSWMCRVAYYTIPTIDCADSSQRLEKLFTSTGGTAKRGKNAPSDSKKSVTEELIRHNKEAKDTLGFRNVDTDDFVLGLSRTVFTWMGNEARSEDFTICFVQRKEIGESSGGAAFIGESPALSNGRMIAVGFQVASADNFLSKGKSEKNSYNLDESPVTRVPGIGVYQRLFDPINKFNVEVFASGSGREKIVGRETVKRHVEKIDFTKVLTRDDVERMTIDPVGALADKMRYPSESAIGVSRTGESSDEEGQIPVPELNKESRIDSTGAISPKPPPSLPDAKKVRPATKKIGKIKATSSIF